MIRKAHIQNFRGFKDSTFEGFNRINVIVGDNGVGKTALLEAIYLALCNSPDRSLLLRQQRGLATAFRVGSADGLADALVSDLLPSPSEASVSIELTGDGFENRQLTIRRGRADVIVETTTSADRGEQEISTEREIVVPVLFTWRDSEGTPHSTRVVWGDKGKVLRFESTGEELPPCFYFSAQTPVAAKEVADTFSLLRVERRHEAFKKAFLRTFDFIKDVSAEGDVLMADVPGKDRLLPLAVVSGATNRAAAILLSLARRENGVVLVDEVENGVYHRRQQDFAKSLLELARKYDTQLIVTTHSDEWLKYFEKAAGRRVDDIALWRMERSAKGDIILRRFSGEDALQGVRSGEMR